MTSFEQPSSTDSVVIGLSAAIVAVTEYEPRVLVVRRAADAIGEGVSGEGVSGEGGSLTVALPSGPFDPVGHRTLDSGLRSWVEEQTRLKLGYVEQLYTFGDKGRDPREWRGGPRIVSVGYLALVREAAPAGSAEATWLPWYRFFPWEDWRDGRPAIIDRVLAPRLGVWADSACDRNERRRRARRIEITFGQAGAPWDEERVLERYELLYEAGLVREAVRDRRLAAEQAGGAVDADEGGGVDADTLRACGEPMTFDYRRILATAMGRLRGKLKYRPLVFEVLPPGFTLTELQLTVEALAGLRLHKQNFRRLIAKTGLVEPTGRMVTATGGRPAEQYRFRAEVVQERSAPGVRLPGARQAR